MSSESKPTERPPCSDDSHAVQPRRRKAPSDEVLEKAAGIFSAAGDVARLRILDRLMDGEQCVTALSEVLQVKMSTLSQQLRLLREENVVRSRRDGKHIHYALADDHIRSLLRSILIHAGHCTDTTLDDIDNDTETETTTMACKEHANHTHQHGPGCGHTAIEHDDHIDYLHDGHLHHPHEDHVDEHVLEVTGSNPDACTPDHQCSGHEAGHIHGPNCGHEAVPHGNHVDYLVDGHLHHPHGSHCDNHGPVAIAA